MSQCALPSGITSDHINAFKGTTDEEERIIKQLSSPNLRHLVSHPLVDVGCGSGKIAAGAYPRNDVILLDRMSYSGQNPPNHNRVQTDFYDPQWSAAFNIGTLSFCHVLQYIDEDMRRLQQRIADLAPKTIIAITNECDGFYSELINWASTNLQPVNPELPHYDFSGYSPVYSSRFDSSVSAKTMDELAVNVVAALLDRRLSADEKNKTIHFLDKQLGTPQFNIPQILRVYAQSDNIVPFYGDDHPLSNFYRAAIEIGGETFPTVEHYYQSQKFILHPEIYASICRADTPADAKNFSRTHKVHVRSDWQKGVKEELMMTATLAKFIQHPDLWQILAKTRDKILLEASPDDDYWGVTPEGHGVNKMGQILMDVRARLSSLNVPSP